MLSILFINLYYFTLLTITHETYKKRKLKHCLNLMKIFKISNLVTKILHSSEKTRKLTGGPNNSGRRRDWKFFQKKSGGPPLIRNLRVHT